MGKIKRLLLDTLKPLKGLSIIDIAKEIVDMEGLGRVTIKVDEMDVETVTLSIIVEGDDIDFEKLKAALEERGVVIHSIDEVTAEKE
ncbi:hypothetical protein EYM_06050 [Ignicoccus islandicus DSM 13165]|uniref:DUF211 domain-containing protein n=1 Tax=Ignicoccus islandicus DSM 13165 TaxID=940295 RepID=A0A0U3FR05_9CREN|nr:DUF211 domain-containing protein [Ignicoccus islandicus]ALU11904.1 hypothetical protein EYM_06050 [Ignicoccus islandicus DSM 13165]